MRAFGSLGHSLEMDDHLATRLLIGGGRMYQDGLRWSGDTPRSPALTPGTDEGGGIDVADRHPIATARADDRTEIERDRFGVRSRPGQAASDPLAGPEQQWRPADLMSIRGDPGEPEAAVEATGHAQFDDTARAEVAPISLRMREERPGSARLPAESPESSDRHGERAGTPTR